MTAWDLCGSKRIKVECLREQWEWGPVLVVYIYNPSYWGGRDLEDW
jgi:hypothetical protein